MNNKKKVVKSFHNLILFSYLYSINDTEYE
mgnify:CR=1 FL=1